MLTPMPYYSLGSILLKSGLITETQLNSALQQQRSEPFGWRLLGEILVESRLITHRDLNEALKRQAQLLEIEFFGIRIHPATRSWSKRGLDLMGAIAGLGVMGLLLPFVATAIWLESPGPLFVAQVRVGLRGKQFRLWRFRTTTPNAERQRLRIASEKNNKFFNPQDEPEVTRVGRILRGLYLDEIPQFWNVLMGEMSLVGTRPPTLDEVKAYDYSDWQRLSIKPGITGVWQVSHQKYLMDFDRVVELDLSYIKHWTPSSDLKLLSSTALHVLGGPRIDRSEALRQAAELHHVDILNVPIDNLTIRELLEQLKSGVVLTPNVDHLMKLQRDEDFYQTYALADYRVCDSQILFYASRFLGTPLKEKISGSDFFPIFCDFHRENDDITIFLLGGAEGVAARAMERINQKTGRRIIIQAHSPSFGFEKNEEECQQLVEMINRSGATVLAVGVGAPKQEKWICKYRDQLTPQIFLAVGATIDFEAGTIQRAPKWISKIGMEWLFRIACDPKRLWKRYIMDDLPFFGLLLQQRLGWYDPPVFKTTISVGRSRPFTLPPAPSPSATIAPISPRKIKA
jgi:N-acetylglucosaminyldiphosphoundecaprenol N-acetyl-beta-D-mannosaminyltransferase